MNDMFDIEYQDGGPDRVRLRLAANVRRLRIAGNVSISQLARATGMSKATLSGIEQGRANPTIDTLAGIARALSVAIDELLRDAEPPEMKIVRAGPTDTAKRASGEPRHLDSIGPTGTAELFQLWLSVQQTMRREARSNGWRSHLFVLQGTLIAGPSDRISELGAGDYASFPADVPHLYETVRRSARALVLETGPATPSGRASAR